MGTVTITESVKQLDCIDQVFFTVDATGIKVTMPAKPSYEQAFVSWDNLNDVESLAEVFADWTVREFKVVVPVLSKIYNNKQTFTEL